jgi:predicted DNA-binding protein (UPF0251 family)
MPRRTRCRIVEFFPNSTSFAPIDKKNKEIRKIELKIEELEAMRLKDIMGLSQQDCAEKMGISRQTFQNIIDSARHKVALALTEGLGIEIRGGDFTSDLCEVKCNSCNAIYRVKYLKDRFVCPICNSHRVDCHNKNSICGNWCQR